MSNARRGNVDQIEIFVEQAHRLFGKTSVFEVIDLPTKQEAINLLVEFYGMVDVGKVDLYLLILDRLRVEMGEGGVKYGN